MTRAACLLSADARMLCEARPAPELAASPHLAHGATPAEVLLHDDGRCTGWLPGLTWAAHERPGLIDLLADGRPAPAPGGPFVALDPRDAADLLFLLGNRWLPDSAGAPTRPGDVLLQPGHLLRAGPVLTDLSLPMPFQTLARRDDGAPFEIVLTSGEGWMIERLRLFRPLIYLNAFGIEEIFEQLRHCLRSLHEFGAYDFGFVHVLGDRPRDALEPYVPPALSACVTSSVLPASSRSDYLLARFRIDAWAPARECQPLLYVDTDIVFDAPVMPMLQAIARSAGLCPQREDSSALDRHIGSGSELFRAAGIAPPPDARGFNAGQFGFPNLARCGGLLRTILGAAENTLARRRSDSVPYWDQAFANYVCYVLGAADMDALTPFVDVGHGGRHTNARRRTGMVHFWPFMTPHDKRNAMAMYIEAVRKQRALDAAG